VLPVLAFLLLLRIVQDYMVYPHLIRKRLKLHPMAVVIALWAGRAWRPGRRRSLYRSLACCRCPAAIGASIARSKRSSRTQAGAERLRVPKSALTIAIRASPTPHAETWSISRDHLSKRAATIDQRLIPTTSKLDKDVVKCAANRGSRTMRGGTRAPVH